MAFSGLFLLAACSKPPPPRTVVDFMENPILLEATMVRCGQNRSELKYEAECVNAREAVNRLAAAEQQARRAEFEQQSERKRQALRRTQEAAAAARERAREAQRLREEAEYLGIFEQLPTNGGGSAQPAGNTAPLEEGIAGNEPGVTVSPPEPEASPQPVEMQQEAEQPEVGSDLDSIREELRRRQEQPE